MQDSVQLLEQLKTLEAYRVEYKDNLTDINSFGAVLRHIKSGARICIVANDDDNKFFSIGFRTTPADSTGVPHIIEHTVLCGSEKFPVKDPFMELAKGSLNTFLNALTFPDKTVYPVASTNDRDFKNLMDVYMDAVLHPNIFKHEEIFKQEGVRYELFDRKDEIKLNGVVYSEMKGAFSDPQEHLAKAVMAALMPDNTYHVISGGDPDVIPSLTYEEYLKFYKRYYHPSNSFVYLYGNCDMKERLNWLDREYLSGYDAIDPDSDVAFQKPTGEIIRKAVNYPSDENGDNSTYITFASVVSDYSDTLKDMAAAVLEEVLLEAPGAPLKKAIIDAGICDDVSGRFDSDLRQRVFSVEALQAGKNKSEDFYNCITGTVKDLIKNGLSKRSILAAINKLEFSYREADYGMMPKGLIYNFGIYETWLYDDSKAFSMLHGNADYEKLRTLLDTGYFEKLLSDIFINTEHACLIELLPDANMGKFTDEALAKKLAEKKASMSAEKIDELIKASNDLRAYQEEPSSQEDLMKIPMLNISDIKRTAEFVGTDLDESLYVPVFRQNIFTSGITYINIYFDLPEIPIELIPYASLLSDVLGSIDTKEHTYLELGNDINIMTGGISSMVAFFEKKGDADYYRPVFKITAKALSENVSYALKYSAEMMYESKLEDTKRLKQIITESKAGLINSMISEPSSAAMSRSLSYISKRGMFGEMVSGMDYLEFIKDIEENFEDRKQEISDKLRETAKLIFTRENCFINVTCDENGYGKFTQALGGFGLAESKIQERRNLIDNGAKFDFKPEKLNEGITCMGQVNYVSVSGNAYRNGFKLGGVNNVINNILSLGYLWDKIRVRGGAYGCFARLVAPSGNMLITTYRDPNISESKKAFDGIPEYLENFAPHDRDMAKYILGTISSADRPLNPNLKGEIALMRKLSGITEESLNKEREEILSCSVEDVRKQAPLYQAMLNENSFLTVGNSDKIQENKELFKKIIPLV